MTPGLAIETRELTRRYGDKVVVDRLNLAVREGTVFGLLGANGAGKSTTLRMLCGLLRRSDGQAWVAGVDPERERRALKRAIGFMPQAFGLYGYLTVRENLDFYADLYVEKRKTASERVKWVIEEAGLGPKVKVRAESLSAGWRQRLALGCAILHKPKVLFLDEPTAGVDPVSRRTFWDLIHTLHESGSTVFVTTHYMEEVERCHEVGMMAEGVMRVAGVPAELKARAAVETELIAVDCDRPEAALAHLRSAPGLLDVYLYGDRLHLAWDRGAGGLERTVSLLGAVVQVRECVPRVATMEDVFVRAGVTVAK
jgi:ABC-2 type transport system ATP-binding protein